MVYVFRNVFCPGCLAPRNEATNLQVNSPSDSYPSTAMNDQILPYTGTLIPCKVNYPFMGPVLSTLQCATNTTNVPLMMQIILASGLFLIV
jgi:hypothetical protein